MFTKRPLALVIGAVLAAPAIAADTDETVVVQGHEHGYKADTNSTAMRMEMTQLETPSQVAVIDEAVIDEQRASTLGEVLQNDASVSEGGKSRNRERFSLRGFSVSSSDGFLRDGRQHWSHYRQPIELLERVEVLKGPSGLLYGKSEPGGLINMVSKKPTADTQFSISQDFGSDDHFRTVVDVSGALNSSETLRARAIVAKEDYSSARQYADGSSPETDRIVGGLVVEFDVTDNITLSAHADKTRDQGDVDSGAYIVDGKPVRGDKYIWDAEWSHIDNEVENMGFDVTAHLSDAVVLKTGYNHQDFKRLDIESYPKFRKYETDGVITHGGNERSDHWEFDTAYLDVTADYSLAGTENTALVGVNFLKYNYGRFMKFYDSKDVAPGTPVGSPTYSARSSYSSKSKYEMYGIYLQNMMTLNEQWQVIAGVRFDEKKSDKVKEDHISPKLGLIYHPQSNGSVYLQYSESFMPLGEVSNGRGRIYTNDGEALDPEIGSAYELGTKWELFDDNLLLSGAIFKTTLENITLDVDAGTDASGNDLLHKTQEGEQVHKGAELMAQGNVTDAFSVMASAIYLDAEITNHSHYSGKTPVDVPEVAASLWSAYQVIESTDVNLGVVYTGSRFGDAYNTYKKDGYTRVDMGVAYNHKFGDNLDFTARLNVENLFDTDYLRGGSQTQTILGEGRNYMATLQIKY